MTFWPLTSNFSVERDFNTSLSYTKSALEIETPTNLFLFKFANAALRVAARDHGIWSQSRPFLNIVRVSIIT